MSSINNISSGSSSNNNNTTDSIQINTMIQLHSKPGNNPFILFPIACFVDETLVGAQEPLFVPPPGFQLLDPELIQNQQKAQSILPPLAFDRTPPDLSLFEEDSTLTFGVVSIEIENEVLVQTPLLVSLCIDRSGSMSGRCIDGSTQIEHVIHSVCQIFEIFVEKIKENPLVEIYVHVYTFDDRIDTFIEPTRINSSNIHQLTEIVKSITARGSTNMELALHHAKRTLSEYHSTFPKHKIVFILLTDGAATDGIVCPKTLSEFVCPEITNIFMGYGSNHNQKMLQTLADTNQTTGQYRYVDKLENAGHVFGELLYNILYPAITDASICI